MSQTTAIKDLVYKNPVDLSINGHFFAFSHVLSSNSLVAIDEASVNLEVGMYLQNIVLIFNDEVHNYCGVISHKNITDRVEYEIDLLQTLPLDLYADQKFVGEVKAFKTKVDYDEIRKSSRVSVRREDGVRLAITVNQIDIQARLYDISSFGLSFITKNKVSEGQSVFFEVVVKNEKYSGTGAVTWVRQLDNTFQIGINFQTFQQRPKLTSLKNIALKESYGIRGVFSRVNFFHERASFRILALSAKNMTIEVDKSDQFILPGMKLDLKFFLSSMSYDDIKPTVLQVVEVQKGQKQSLIVTGNVNSLNADISLNISNYLLQFLDVNPHLLRDAGFKVTKIADAFSFRYVETHDEYLEVLKLRFMAYALAGKVKGDKTAKDMTAGLDSKSRILIVKHQGRIIASASISFPDSEDVTLDTERALANGYPAFIPKKCDMVEISRLCTHPDYRKGDMLHRIFEHTYKIFVMSGRKHIITSCDDKLWPLYKKLGFRKTGESYAHPALEGLLHHLIILPVEVCLKVNKVDFLAWGYLYNSIFSELESKSLVKVNAFYRHKMKLSAFSYKFIEKMFSFYKRIVK